MVTISKAKHETVDFGSLPAHFVHIKKVKDETDLDVCKFLLDDVECGLVVTQGGAQSGDVLRSGSRPLGAAAAAGRCHRDTVAPAIQTPTEPQPVKT